MTTDFYKDFKCKCGECRHCCCVGWNVSVTQAEYFRLLGLKAVSSLRHRLDRAFFVPHDSTEQRFALLNHDYCGNCPLRSDDGLCVLQVKKGERTLPEICRAYPRSVRPELSEVALANSCEGVVEMLFNRSFPIAFSYVDLPKKPCGQESVERADVRRRAIERMQNRSKPISARILDIGVDFGVDSIRDIDFDKKMTAVRAMLTTFGDIGDSVRNYCETAQSALTDIDEKGYQRLSDAVDAEYHKHNEFVENLLVNHLFFEKFPYSDKSETVVGEYVSLCGLYAFLRVLCVGNAKCIGSNKDLIDLYGAVFRVAEHTRFDHNMDIVLSDCGFADAASASALLQF